MTVQNTVGCGGARADSTSGPQSSAPSAGSAGKRQRSRCAQESKASGPNTEPTMPSPKTACAERRLVQRCSAGVAAWVTARKFLNALKIHQKLPKRN